MVRSSQRKIRGNRVLIALDEPIKGEKKKKEGASHEDAVHRIGSEPGHSQAWHWYYPARTYKPMCGSNFNQEREKKRTKGITYYNLADIRTRTSLSKKKKPAISDSDQINSAMPTSMNSTGGLRSPSSTIKKKTAKLHLYLSFIQYIFKFSVNWII